MENYKNLELILGNMNVRKGWINLAMNQTLSEGINDYWEIKFLAIVIMNVSNEIIGYRMVNVDHSGVDIYDLEKSEEYIEEEEFSKWILHFEELDELQWHSEIEKKLVSSRNKKNLVNN